MANAAHAPSSILAFFRFLGTPHILTAMFGNRLGWGISAVIAAVAVYLMVLIIQAGQPTPPSGWAAKTVQPFSVPAEAAAVLPVMSDSTDAGDLYRQAMSDGGAHAEEYANLSKAKDINPAAIAARPGLKVLLAATHCASMDLFKSSPEQIVMYEPDKAPLIALASVTDAAKRVALLSGTNDPATANSYYAALFSLGVKLANERVTFDELSLGEELMGTGAAGMQSLATRAHDSARVQVIRHFDDIRLADYEAKISPVWKVISSIDNSIIAEHAGDIFQLAESTDADLMWRVESTLKLGRMRFNADRRGDQVNAKRVLKQLAADSKEPAAVQIAAAAARDLTIEQYRQLR